jgi:regulator of PEP synthase PpsR (kinase-PPPase family)
MTQDQEAKRSTQEEFPLFIVSGGAGTSGELVTRTVLAQFEPINLPVRVFAKIFYPDQVQEVFEQAQGEKGLVIHSFVDPKLRQIALRTAKEMGVESIDLIGPLMDQLSIRLTQAPLGKPGRYRQLHKSYFDRVDAINYAMEHDDGKNHEGWKAAEIILIGPSRVGKTPLSLYLSVLGWKVANIPIIPEIPPNQDFDQIPREGIVGLTIDPTELVRHRKHRMSQLGVPMRGEVTYIDPVRVFEEVSAFEDFAQHRGIHLIDVTNKPIESSAEQVIQTIKRHRR